MTSKGRRPPSCREGREKSNALKSTHEIKNLVKELDQAGRRYTKRRKGYCDQLYDSMQTAQRVIAECLKSKSSHSEFVRLVQLKATTARSRSVRFNLSLEAMARSTGAIDIEARKLASKHAKVLDYLRKIGVRVEDTATTVRKEGIEKLNLKARKESGKSKKSTKSRQPASEVKQPISSPVGRGAPRAGHNDTERLMPLWLKQSHKDELLGAKLGTRLTVVVLRVSEDDGDIQVQGVAPGDHLNDFEG